MPVIAGFPWVFLVENGRNKGRSKDIRALIVLVWLSFLGMFVVVQRCCKEVLKRCSLKTCCTDVSESKNLLHRCVLFTDLL